MSDSVLIFANPIAGHGKGRATAERLATRLARDGYSPTVVFKRQDVQGAPDIPIELTTDTITFSQNNLTLLFVRS